MGMCATNENKLKGSIYNVKAENPDDVLYCVYCDLSFESWHAYKMHVLSHGTPATGLVTLLDTEAVPAQTTVRLCPTTMASSMDILGLGLEVSPPKQRNAKKSKTSGSVAPEEKEILQLITKLLF